METPYARSGPSVQQTLDLFRGAWASRLPAALQPCEAGTAGLFEDPRVDWAAAHLAKLGVEVKGADVLELGPLEGGHSYRLSQLGATVTAIEAHRDAYLKCLVVKELLSLSGVRFLYGDAVEYLRHCGTAYAVGFASGFLYHMSNPVELIQWLCERCRSVFVWTVYHDEAFAREHPTVPAGSGPVTVATHGGFTHRLHRHDYGSGFAYNQFWGGPAPFSQWMEKDDILGAFEHFGFRRQIWETETNPNGAALRLVAAR